jgi:TetR/AcrR family transcriptional repressor of nem operon
MKTGPKTGDTRQRILDAANRIMAAGGFSGVGINEVLAAAGVPKGSFYHHFGSKDAFGEALIERYFDRSLAELDLILRSADLSTGQRLMNYWKHWSATQMGPNLYEKCLAVKLGAEVSDLSETMRLALSKGTERIIERIAAAILRGTSDGSIAAAGEPKMIARTLYQMWLGASVMAKITRSHIPFQDATVASNHLLNPKSRDDATPL